MELQEHQKRVIEEKAELDEKLGRLKEFFTTDTFNNVDAVEQQRLRRQASVMNIYSDVLGERVSAFLMNA